MKSKKIDFIELNEIKKREIIKQNKGLYAKIEFIDNLDLLSGELVYNSDSWQKNSLSEEFFLRASELDNEMITIKYDEVYRIIIYPYKEVSKDKAELSNKRFFNLLNKSAFQSSNLY